VLLGKLEHFLAAPSMPLMLVRGEREYAVPAGPPHLRRVDLQRHEIEVDWPADF
jgi:ribosomal 30S subunit maturation factor RimM